MFGVTLSLPRVLMVRKNVPLDEVLGLPVEDAPLVQGFDNMERLTVVVDDHTSRFGGHTPFNAIWVAGVYVEFADIEARTLVFEVDRQIKQPNLASTSKMEYGPIHR
ncbi:unnamed protein product [Phytophthora fragariaefolia]|uniref:Unnamed protein product n=1 Tax=Phytophthora fragariaefolia TaxID=1490495 RepID=A0A9W6YAB0_9STRA|nr:unnamed protein product [Phytophthora fragariaefolia]